MSGNKAVLDSNFLIFLSKGVIDLESVRERYDKVYASIITYIEVYAYHFAEKTEKETLDDVFNFLQIIEIDSQVAEFTIAYRKNQTKKIKLADAIILASAKSVGADLITDNYRDFQDIDEGVNILALEEFRS